MTTTMSSFEGQEERAPTQFESVGNAPPAYNGYTLMVIAYALIWAILMVWLMLMWQKSRGIASRLAALDVAIDRAVAKADAAEAKGRGTDGNADP